MLWVLVAAIVLAVGEVMSLSFFLAPFAIGALFGAAAELAGARRRGRIVVGLPRQRRRCCFGFVRPIARRHLRTPAQMRTGTAALVGKTAIVHRAHRQRRGGGR